VTQRRFQKTLYIPVTEVMHKWLEDHAGDNGKTITELVRSAIEATYPIPKQWGRKAGKVDKIVAMEDDDDIDLNEDQYDGSDDFDDFDDED
jgi:hypothetical protein